MPPCTCSYALILSPRRELARVCMSAYVRACVALLCAFCLPGRVCALHSTPPTPNPKPRAQTPQRAEIAHSEMSGHFAKTHEGVVLGHILSDLPPVLPPKVRSFCPAPTSHCEHTPLALVCPWCPVFWHAPRVPCSCLPQTFRSLPLCVLACLFYKGHAPGVPSVALLLPCTPSHALWCAPGVPPAVVCPG